MSVGREHSTSIRVLQAIRSLVLLQQRSRAWEQQLPSSGLDEAHASRSPRQTNAPFPTTSNTNTVKLNAKTKILSIYLAQKYHYFSLNQYLLLCPRALPCVRFLQGRRAQALQSPLLAQQRFTHTRIHLGLRLLAQHYFGEEEQFCRSEYLLRFCSPVQSPSPSSHPSTPTVRTRKLISPKYAINSSLMVASVHLADQVSCDQCFHSLSLRIVHRARSENRK